MADQKLNIIFTGDVSQLNKAIQSAEAELTSFENKAKGISGFDLSGLSQQIDSIRNKFASIKVDVDPSKALTELNRISSETAKLKDVFIGVDVDTTGVFSEIDSIVKKIKGIDLGTLSFPDIQNATSEINKVLAQLSKLKDTDVLLKVDNAPAIAAIDKVESDLKSVRSNIIVQLDSTRLNSDLQDIRAKFAALQQIDIKADPSAALSAIDKILSEINSVKSQEILLDADNSEALSSITDIQKRIEGIRSSITLSVDVDTAINSIKNKFQSLGVLDLKANPQQALTAINEILQDIAKIKSNEILLKSDNTDVLSDINQIQTRLQEIKSTVKISADLDTSKLESLLKPLSTQVSVNINTKAAEAEITALLNQVKNLKGQDILINLDGTQVIRTVDAIEKELLNLQSAIKKATNPADIAKLTQQLQVFKNSLSSNNVNQFSSSIGKAQQATFAFSQVLREAPSFAFSLQTGLLGISNNLPILADRFKEARASGLSTGKIFGDMAKSLVSLPGLMTIASTAAIFLAGAFNKSGDEAKDFTKELDDVRKVLSSSAASVQGDISRVQALAQAFKNSEGSFEKQKRVLSELKEINENYFGQLKAGKTTYEDITKASNAYADALVQEAVIKGLSNSISKLSEQLGDATIAYADATKAADDQRRVLEKTIRDNRDVVQGLTAQNQAVNLAQNSYDKLQGKLTEAANAVGKINTRIGEFRDLINQKVFEQLKIKPLVDPKTEKGFKDTTENIIARARAFVKQFGEVFVVPDLDESFTNTKDKILVAAKKLLDDVSKGNLQIKIPVQVVTELDFLPVQVDEKLTEQKLKEVTDNFFSSIKLEKQELEAPVTINAGNIQLLEQVRKIFKDLKAEIPKDLKLKLLDESSFVSFDRLNEAIKQAQNNFLLLQTIGDSVGQGLANAFDNVFDALLEGQNVFKALGESVKALVVETIKAIAKMLILKAVTKILSGGVGVPLPGAGPAGGTFNPFSGITGGSRANLGGFFGAIGSQSAPTLTTRVSGTDLVFVLNQGNRIIGFSG